MNKPKYDKLLSLTLKNYTRPMLDMVYGTGFTSDMTDEEVDNLVQVYINSPWRCSTCGQMVNDDE